MRTREIIKEVCPEVSVSLSSEVNPIFREYERTVVTAFDAYMRPTVERFMADLEGRMHDFGVKAEIHVMQSRGGVTSTRIAGQQPVHLFLSGPAGGVVGGAKLASVAGYADVVTLDIGGTSCDVALISGGVPAVNPSGEIAGYRAVLRADFADAPVRCIVLLESEGRVAAGDSVESGAILVVVSPSSPCQ